MTDNHDAPEPAQEAETAPPLEWHPYLSLGHVMSPYKIPMNFEQIGTRPVLDNTNGNCGVLVRSKTTGLYRIYSPELHVTCSVDPAAVDKLLATQQEKTPVAKQIEHAKQEAQERQAARDQSGLPERPTPQQER